MIEELKRDIQLEFQKVNEKSSKQQDPDIAVLTAHINKISKKMIKKPSNWKTGEHISYHKSRKIIQIK